MPISVLENMDVAYVESLSNMGTLLSEIITSNNPQPVEVPQDIIQEAIMDKRVSTRVEDLSVFEKSEFNCPDCGGGLWITQKDHPTHFRCHVGHSFTERELMIRQTEVLENTFWAALRLMEERRALLMRLATRDRERGYHSTSSLHLEKAKDLDAHIENLKRILLSAGNPD